MNHRKLVHPSIKRCRNFPDGKCTFGMDCWYVHEEQLMDVDESFKGVSGLEDPKFKCYICTNDFEDKNSFMRHKKEFHVINVKSCEQFEKDKCLRKDEDCWFSHMKSTNKNVANQQPKKSPVKEQQVFQEVSEKSPPDQAMKTMMDALGKLCSKVELMERRFKELMN